MNKVMNKIGKLIRKFNIEVAVFVFFIAIHLPFLGHEMFNTDAWKWKARTYDFGQGVFTLNFEKTIQKYHPGVTLMWVGTGAVKAYNLYYDLVLGHPPANNDVTTFELHFTQKLLLVTVISLVLASCVYVLKREFGKRVALFFGLLVSLEPFYYALTRVFHLEGLMSTLMLASFLWFYHYLQEKKPFKLILASFFAALAFLTKTSSLYLVPFMALLAFLHRLFKVSYFNEFTEKAQLKDSQQIGKVSYFLKNTILLLKQSIQRFFKVLYSLEWLKPFGIWLLLSYLGFYLFWPAMWTMPEKALETVYRGVSTIGMERGHLQIYFGEMTENPGPYYYLVVFALRSSVVLFLGILLSFFTFKWSDKKEKKFLLYTVLFTVFYAIQITIPSKKLDRYILPSILSLSLIVSFLFSHLYTRLRKGVGMVLILLILGWGIFNFVKLEKDYFSYFNPLFGGLETGMRILEPKWIIGHHEIVDYLKDQQIPEEYENDNGEVMIAFPEKYYAQIWLFVKELGYRPVIKDLTPHAKQAHLFFYPIWFDDSYKEERFPLEYEKTIYLRDVPVWNVYRRVWLP